MRIYTPMLEGDVIWSSSQKLYAYIYRYIYRYIHTHIFICTYAIGIYTYNVGRRCDHVFLAKGYLHTCAMTHLNLCHDSFLCVPRLIHLCAIYTYNVGRRCHHFFLAQAILIRVPWLFQTCAMTPSYACHDSFICLPRLNRLCPIYTHNVCRRCDQVFLAKGYLGWRAQETSLLRRYIHTCVCICVCTHM